MSIVVSSTTDSQEAVNAAAGITTSGADAQVESTEETAAEPKKEPPPEEPVDNEDEDEEQDQEVDTQQPPAPKRKGGYLRKIEALERERGYAARRIEELESRLAGARKPAGETQPQGPAPKPTQDQYQSYEEYVEALTDYKLEQRELQMAEKARAWHAQEQERQRLAGWEQRVGEYKQTAADFDDVLLAADHITLPPALQQAIVESETGPALAYALARDPRELERIAKLPPLAAVRALGAFEARILDKEKPAPKQAAPPPVSKAPPPVKAIANGSAATAAPRMDDPNISFADYRRLRNRDIAANRG